MDSAFISLTPNFRLNIAAEAIDYQTALENTLATFQQHGDLRLSRVLIVTQSMREWGQYHPTDPVVSFADYIDGNYPASGARARVINLCQKFYYLSEGYYCSLLAEARGDNVIPSVRTLSDLSKRSLYRIHLEELSESLYRSLEPTANHDRIVVHSFFGRTTDPRFEELARALFGTFPCPILEIRLEFRGRWQVSRLKPRAVSQLSSDQRAAFYTELEEFSRKVWRRKPRKKAARYDLAVLVDPTEAMPPSNSGALKRFIRAGRDLGVNCRLITQRDYFKLAEFDGLFIRATTNIDHYTYRFAKKAENEGMVAIDDSSSILRCTNKIYLADLFRKNGVPTPHTLVLYKDRKLNLAEIEQALGYPIVVKIPDGAFSRGVEKARDADQLKAICERLFRESTLLLAQEYLYTEFDWRIGILDRQPLYACRYYMVKRHWQIYRHGSRSQSGGFDTLPVDAVPDGVVQAALSATRHIGDGFYGVDVKEKGGQGYVIEVNDNPSIDSGIEDRHLGIELYRRVIGTMLERMDARRRP
jgi:glutathione synthase/RimK-type ligase-like ATP-grasp enzyme